MYTKVALLPSITVLNPGYGIFEVTVINGGGNGGGNSGVVGARYGRRLSPAVLRAAIVVLGLIGLWRLLTT